MKLDVPRPAMYWPLKTYIQYMGLRLAFLFTHKSTTRPTMSPVRKWQLTHNTPKNAYLPKIPLRYILNSILLRARRWCMSPSSLEYHSEWLILRLTRILTPYGDLHSHNYHYVKCKEMYFSEPKYLFEMVTFTFPFLAYRLSDLSEAFCKMLSHFLDNECLPYHLVS